MTARRVEGNGHTIALVVEPGGGRRPYLVEPIVFDEAGEVVMGREVLSAIIKANTHVEVPVLRGFSPAMLAELDAQLAHICESLQLGGSTDRP